MRWEYKLECSEMCAIRSALPAMARRCACCAHAAVYRHCPLFGCLPDAERHQCVSLCFVWQLPGCRDAG